MGKRLRTSGQGNSHQSKHRNSSLTLIVLWKWLTRDVPTERKQIGRGTFHQPHRPLQFSIAFPPPCRCHTPFLQRVVQHMLVAHECPSEGQNGASWGEKKKKRKEGRGWASVAERQERGEGPKLKPLELLRTRPVGHSNGWSYWEIGGV